MSSRLLAFSLLTYQNDKLSVSAGVSVCAPLLFRTALPSPKLIRTLKRFRSSVRQRVLAYKKRFISIILYLEQLKSISIRNSNQCTRAIIYSQSLDSVVVVGQSVSKWDLQGSTWECRVSASSKFKRSTDHLVSVWQDRSDVFRLLRTLRRTLTWIDESAQILNLRRLLIVQILELLYPLLERLVAVLDRLRLFLGLPRLPHVFGCVSWREKTINSISHSKITAFESSADR